MLKTANTLILTYSSTWHSLSTVTWVGTHAKPRNQESGERTVQKKSEWEWGKRDSTAMLLRSNLWSLCICIQTYSPPSAHIISSLLVTSTKTKRSRMLQMYYVGGIIKSNPSQSQLYLPKDTGQSCMHSWCVCLHMCAYLCAFVSMSNFQSSCSHKNISLNILALSKMGKQLLRV